MRNKAIVLFFAVISAKAILAQNPNTDYKFGIKLYNLSRYEPITEIVPVHPFGMNYIRVTKDQFKLLHPTIALQWRTKKGNFHEIEITDLKWDDDHTQKVMMNDSIKSEVIVFEDKITESAFALRYEYILMLRKKKDCRLVPSIGFAGSPFYNSIKTRPLVSFSYPTKEQHMGLQAFVTPRLTYYTKKRIYFDLNMPICVAAGELTKTHTDDPSVPAEERNVSAMDMSIFKNMFSARVGIGIKL